MSEKLTEKAFEYIDAIAEGLGIAAAHVYAVMARQMFAEGVVWTALLLAIVIGVPWIGVKVARRIYAKWDDFGRSSQEALAYVGFIAGIAAVIFVVIAFLHLPGAVMKTVNPEYYVIREILDVVKGGGQ